MDAATRRDYARNRKNYASDMTDAEWEKIKPYLCCHLRPRLCAHDLVSRRGERDIFSAAIGLPAGTCWLSNATSGELSEWICRSTPTVPASRIPC